MFERVSFKDSHSITWDYKLYTDSNYKGYHHWHQCCELLFVHRGEGSIIVNQQLFNIERGMLFFFQPYQLHQIYSNVSTEVPFERSIFYIDPYRAEAFLENFPYRKQLFSMLWKGNRATPVFNVSDHAEIVEWTLDNYNRLSKNGIYENSEHITVLLLQLLEVIGMDDRLLVHTNLQRKLHYSEKIMSWIEQHYHEEFSLDRLADAVHLSKAYVSRIFHKETGSRLSDYLKARRIKQACQLLMTSNRSIEEIGIEVGIPNASYFNQAFKQMLGVTPLHYRKTHNSSQTE